MIGGGPTGLRNRLEQFMGRPSASAAAQEMPPSRIKSAAKRWARRHETIEMPAGLRRQRLRETAQRLKDGAGSEITLGDLRLALVHMRSEEAFTSSTIARHRLVSEAISRPGKTPLNILFKSFFQNFEAGSSETQRIYEHMRKNANLLRAHSREFVQAVGFFDGNFGLDTIVNSVDLRNPVRSLAKLGLREEWQDSLFGLAIKCALIERTLVHVDLDAQPLKTILGWIELGERNRPDLQTAYYEILLSPFVAKDPSPDVRRTITRFLLGHFGDPRSVSWPKLRDDTGRLKRDACLAVMERWLDSGVLR